MTAPIAQAPTAAPPPIPDYDSILQQIAGEVEPLLGKGRAADYIAPLANVQLEQFGMAVVTLDGAVHAVGQATQKFSIQSISKLFTLTMAFGLLGDAIWQRVGREPSGNPFNSLVQLEVERGIPRNPFINAGALVITDILTSRFVQPELALLQALRSFADCATLDFNLIVAREELRTAQRNLAMANFIKSFGNLANPVDDVVRSYCFQCSIEMSCIELARAALFLANHGALPWSGVPILSASSAKRINALMLTCGTYDAAGDFAFRVGLPAKSGVGGGIVAVVPGQCAVCVWSPGLDHSGNSLAGVMALERFTDLTFQSIF